ncbi:MAG: PQQ-dependent sugar dehydrogenase [Desertimonas sp.]
MRGRTGRHPLVVMAATAFALAGLGACDDDDERGHDGTAVDTAVASGDAVTTSAAPTTTTTPAPGAGSLTTLPLTLQPVATGLPLLTSLAGRPDGLVVVTSQSGEVWRLAPDGTTALYLDLTADVSPYEPGSERGMLGSAFHPVDGRLFLSYTDPAMDSHVISFAVDPAGAIDPASRVEVLFEDQPDAGFGHKGGGLVFAPDGTLYLALGDGGASNGRDAQDPAKLLGGIVRIVPRGAEAGYDIPPDNPWVDQPPYRPELIAKGLRNPWGFCRDAATGDLWLGDVGNEEIEEVNHILAGQVGMNFGWYQLEGTSVRHEPVPDGAIPPVYEYRHDTIGPAVIGGCVYHGTAIPGLVGAYVFADLAGAVMALGAGYEMATLPVHADGPVTAVALGPDGEIYVLTHSNGIFRLAPG